MCLEDFVNIKYSKWNSEAIKRTSDENVQQNTTHKTKN